MPVGAGLRNASDAGHGGLCVGADRDLLWDSAEQGVGAGARRKVKLPEESLVVCAMTSDPDDTVTCQSGPGCPFSACFPLTPCGPPYILTCPLKTPRASLEQEVTCTMTAATHSAAAQEVLAAIRLGRACGYELDEATTRSVMQMVGIDPGPVWDRPLQHDPKRMPIRPDALTRFGGLLDLADAPRTRLGKKASRPAVLCSCASSTAPDLRQPRA